MTTDPIAAGRFASLDGRSALVTGGAQGIGAACAEALARAGAAVVLTDVDLARAETTAATLAGNGLSVRAERLDVTDTSSVDAVAARFPDLDIVVCNAGIAHNIAAEEMTDAEWGRMIDINLTGVFRCCRAFGRNMLARGSDSIVNIGSMSGQIVNTPQPQCHYNAAKAGVHHLTKSLAVEWATRGVRINAVAPTYIDTPLLHGVESRPGMLERWLDLTPMGRLGKPHEIASIVVFLASDAASLMTGSVVLADGGYTSL